MPELPNAKPAVVMRVFRVSNHSLDIHHEAQLSTALSSDCKPKYELASKRASDVNAMQLGHRAHRGVRGEFKRLYFH